MTKSKEGYGQDRKIIHTWYVDICTGLTVELKCCAHCKVWKELEDFNRHRSNWDSLQHYCRDCDRASGRNYSISHTIQKTENEKRRRTLRKEMGRCVRCGKSVPMDGYLQCEDCLGLSRKRATYNPEEKKRKRLEKANNGICTICEYNTATPGMATCARCRKRVNNWHHENKVLSMKKGKWKIYFLYNPRFPDDIKYVGITSMDLRKRLIFHLQASKKNNPEKYHWLYRMKEQAIEVGIREFWPGLVVPDRREAECLENMLIRECLREGFTLLNIQGIPGGQDIYRKWLKEDWRR